MFEISKIRLRRLKTLTVYGLAIYGAFSLIKGCENETFGHEISKMPTSKIEYITAQRTQDKAISLLETKLENIYVR